MKLYVDERELDRRRFEAAVAAMAGLLADHKDHEDERICICPDGTKAGERITRTDHSFGIVTRHRKSEAGGIFREDEAVLETCAQAVARLAVEHADALLAKLAK